MLTYGELTLSENENNLVALLILASAIAERTSRRDIDYQEKLVEVERYAGRALQQISNLRKPPHFTIAQWVATKKDAEATPRAALGLIALIREDFARAEAEFKMATTLASRPDPVTWYRLGLSYSYQEKYDLALEALEQSATAGGVRVPSPGGGTRDLVSEAKEFALKSKAVSGCLSPALFCSSPRSVKRREVRIPGPDHCSLPDCSSANRSSANYCSVNTAERPGMLARHSFFQQMGPGEMGKEA